MAKDTMTVMRKLYADGRIIECNESMTLAHMQAFVGGDIELVRSSVPHRALIINESGTLDNLPTNECATLLTMPGTLMLNGIQGNALVVKH